MTDPDGELLEAQGALLARYAPTAVVRRIAWSGGETQAIELGAGEPLLLIHGGGDGAYEWVPILDALSRQRRVIAIDRPGHGLADPFDYRGVDLLEHARAFLMEVMDSLELESSAVLANSMGGLWAASFALAEPARVSRLVIAGVPPGLTREAPLPLRMMGLPLVGRSIGRIAMRNPSREGNRKFWGQLLVVHPERLADEFLDVDVAHTRRNVDSVLGVVRLAVGPRGVRHGVLLGDGWHGFAAPTLFLTGEHDGFVTPRIAEALARAAASNPLVESRLLPDAGHVPWLDQPESFARVLVDFLS